MKNKPYHIHQYIYAACLLIAVCCATVFAHAQDSVAATASLSQKRMVIGDQINLKLELNLPRQAKHVYFPVIPDSIGKVEILKKNKLDTLFNDFYSLYTQTLIITAFDSGNYVIPPFIFRYEDVNGEVKDVKTQAINLEVATIPVDTSKAFKPIFDIQEEAAPDLITRIKEHVKENKRSYILIVVVLLLTGFLIYFLFFRKKKKKAPLPPEIPYIKARRLLSELEQSELWPNREYKAYFTRLSDLIRGYLDDSYVLNAQEMTTRDLLHKVKKSQELRKIHGELRQILQTADLAKFAKTFPSEEEKTQAVKNAYKIIETTQPKEEVASAQ